MPKELPHDELTEKSAQQWLKIRRYTPVPEGDVSEQGLKEVGGDGTACQEMERCAHENDRHQSHGPLGCLLYPSNARQSRAFAARASPARTLRCPRTLARSTQKPFSELW
jgi:hypothetical protein